MTTADEVAALRREYDKRLEEYAAENAALRDRIKGDRMSYLAECKYKEEIERLRRELEEAFEMARGIGEERNELAFSLGAAEAVIAAARKWYAIQRGTMAALSPSGVALRDALMKSGNVNVNVNGNGDGI